MRYEAATVDEYIAAVPADRKGPLEALRAVLLEHLPEGFEEHISYGMPSYSVPLSHYPAGYRGDTGIPLPFISFASQKQYISFYHLGIYADAKLLSWFTEAYGLLGIGKLDMGKSCIRFRKPGLIPFSLIGELAGKMTPDEWVRIYESHLRP